MGKLNVLFDEELSTYPSIHPFVQPHDHLLEKTPQATHSSTLLARAFHRGMLQPGQQGARLVGQSHARELGVERACFTRLPIHHIGDLLAQHHEGGGEEGGGGDQEEEKSELLFFLVEHGLFFLCCC